ncbi:MAG: hypothetical protein WC836_03080 [Desulfobacula sp.]
MDQQKIDEWTNATREGLKVFLSGISNPEIISVETLDYPFSYIEPLIREFHLSVCVDAGHQIRYGYDPFQPFDTYKSRIPIIHLHGVDGSGGIKKDHKALDVFSLESLNRSLLVLSRYFQDIPYPIPEESLQDCNSRQ